MPTPEEYEREFRCAQGPRCVMAKSKRPHMLCRFCLDEVRRGSAPLVCHACCGGRWTPLFVGPLTRGETTGPGPAAPTEPGP